jgi:hypothetical protein
MRSFGILGAGGAMSNVCDPGLFFFDAPGGFDGGGLDGCFEVGLDVVGLAVGGFDAVVGFDVVGLALVSLGRSGGIDFGRGGIGDFSPMKGCCCGWGPPTDAGGGPV